MGGSASHLSIGDRPPTAAELDLIFLSLERLSSAGLVAIGHTEYLDGGPSGRFGPVRHVAEALSSVRQRVEAACTEVGATFGRPDWEYSCWLVNTDRGDAVARGAVEARKERRRDGGKRGS